MEKVSRAKNATRK